MFRAFSSSGPSRPRCCLRRFCSSAGSGSRRLPVNDLPNVDFPDDLGDRPSARRQSRKSWPTPWRCRSSASSAGSPGIDEMTSNSTNGNTRITLHVLAEARHRFRRPGRADGDFSGHSPPAGRHARSADAAQAESRRCAGSDTRRQGASMSRCPSSTSSPTPISPSAFPP